MVRFSIARRRHYSIARHGHKPGCRVLFRAPAPCHPVPHGLVKQAWLPRLAPAGYDLPLSGHIHGGRFFPWNPGIGLLQPFSPGLRRVERRMWLYVGAGTGYRGPPNRPGVPPEITELRLSAA